MSPISRILRTAALVVVITAATTAATITQATAATAASGSSSCAVVWGSLVKNSNNMTSDSVVNVRTGQHTCYDRLVVDLHGSGGTVGYNVSYVDNVFSEGKGDVVPLAGGAKIQIVVRGPAYDTNTGALTYSPAEPAHLTSVSGYRTFRQVAYAGSFEGQTTIGLGVRARLPMRVFVLDGPGAGQRLVVDVAHSWT